MTDEEKAAEEQAAAEAASAEAASAAAATLARKKAETAKAAKAEKGLTAADAADMEASIFERVTARLAVKPATPTRPGSVAGRVVGGLVLGLLGAAGLVAFFVFRQRNQPRSTP